MDIFLIFQRPLHWLITTLTETTQSYGLAIILFTIIVRTVLAPLYVAQMRSAKNMALLSPKIKELQKKHGKDRETLTRETMGLYKEHNVNPALGCLLPLVQLPVLWSLFLVLRSLAETKWQGLNIHGANYLKDAALYKAHFLWMDLGKPDPAHLLPIVAGITQWVQQRMMLQPSNDAQQRQINQIMQFLPIMIVVFAWAYPAGLAVYWVTSNIYTMVMQYFIGGVGQLFTSPFTIPYAPASGTVAATPAASGRAGFFSRPSTAAEPAPRAKTASRPIARTAADEAVTDESGAAGGSKMQQYAARHSKGGARGRPSARGAKK